VKAARIHRFGPPDVIVLEDVPMPTPAAGEVLVRVAAAGVGPWDAWIRAGKSAVPQPLPLTLGSDIAGTVAALGEGVAGLAVGDAVFGVSNARFTGGYAEYAAAEAGMLAPMPKTLRFVQAASLPVIAVTAWQMLFEHAMPTRGQRVLVLGATGNVGHSVVQLARQLGLGIAATALPGEAGALRRLGVDEVIDAHAAAFERALAPVDAVLDLVGGDVQARSFAVLKPGGALISAVAPPDQDAARAHGVRASFFLVAVNSATLARIGAMIGAGELAPFVGTALPFAEVRAAHEMLDGARPHPAGKIILDLGRGADQAGANPPSG
jgi:NADPH:quinone reductase-like Zn-dependent oxidoreductase